MILQEKKKYELCIGTSKSTDEVIALYQTWIEQFSVIALVDPLSTLVRIYFKLPFGWINLLIRSGGIVRRILTMFVFVLPKNAFLSQGPRFKG